MGVADQQTPLHFTLALKQNNINELRRKLSEISNPKHPDYRQHLRSRDILSLVAPSQEVRQEILTWLTQGGIRGCDIRDHGDALEINTTVKIATDLFSFSRFLDCVHRPTGKHVIIPRGQWQLPDRLCESIELIVGLSFPPIPLPHNNNNNLLSRDLHIAPSTLQELYEYGNVVEETITSESKTKQMVASFLNESYSAADLALFQNWTTKGSPLVEVVGKNDELRPGTEGTLDVQMITAFPHPNISTVFWLEDKTNWLYEMAIHLFSLPRADLPDVVSISYGWWTDDQHAISPLANNRTSKSYVERVDTEWIKLGLRGVSIVVASGDSGVHGQTDLSCLAREFRPDYPGSSAYVTSVGGTQFLFARKQAQQQQEQRMCDRVECADGTGRRGIEMSVSFDVAGYVGGGGFSNLSATPHWQKAHVDEYLLENEYLLPAPSFWNRNSRAYPDLTSAAHHCLIVKNGRVETIGGTSCSAPIVAGIISLLNLVSLSSTGRSLGFINPLLYQIHTEKPECFHDITRGDNRGTKAGNPTWCQGFYASEGYDVVAGLGSPNVTCLVDYIRNSL